MCECVEMGHRFQYVMVRVSGLYKIVSIVQVFDAQGEGLSDFIFCHFCCCLSHHSVDILIIDKRQSTTTLSLAARRAEARFVASHPACEIAVEDLDEEDNPLWYSICP